MTYLTPHPFVILVFVRETFTDGKIHKEWWTMATIGMARWATRSPLRLEKGYWIANEIHCPFLGQNGNEYYFDAQHITTEKLHNEGLHFCTIVKQDFI